MLPHCGGARGAVGCIIKAFISYRRHDAYIPLKEGGGLDFAFIHTLESALIRAGFDEVFVDTGAIKAGQNFENKIFKAVSDSDLIVVVVGGRWLDILREKRASKERDTLVREIRAGLNQEKEVVPLLIDGAIMPSEIDLPQQIRPFHDRQGLLIKSTDSAETIAAALADTAGKVKQRHGLDSRWVLAYSILSGIAYYCCAIQPHIVGWSEFDLLPWAGIAAIWSGLFIWPAIFLPFALYALRRPILTLIESASNASSRQDKLTYLTPLMFGTLLAGLAIALELSGDETPWTLYPALECSDTVISGDLQLLSHYDQSGKLNEIPSYRNKFWMTNKCWPNVLYYLTVPLYQNAVTEAYLADRSTVAPVFNRLLSRELRAPYSRTFFAYLLSFAILMWLGCTGIVMSIFYVMVQIKRPDDDSVLRLPSEDAYLCLTYTFVTLMIWIPFRINTDYFKYLYSCNTYPRCDVDLKLYLTDAAMAAMLLICYLFLTTGLMVKYRRLALGFLGAFAVAISLLLAFLVYHFRDSLAPVTESWRFFLTVSLPTFAAMIALWYCFNPSIVHFNDFKRDIE
jgi:hypothetical protein